jgi:hypothetical protein
MAIFSCGFEAGDLDYYTDLGWTFSGNNSDIVTTAGRVHQSFNGRGGNQAASFEDDLLSPVFGATGRWFHFWVEGQTTLTAWAVEFRRAGSANFTVQFNPDGVILLRRGTAISTIVADGSFSFTVPHWIEIELLSQDAAGICNVYVDGVLAASFTGDTQNSGTAGWDQVFFSSNNINLSVDDIIVTTAAEGQLGERFLPGLAPEGNDLINSEATSTGGAGSFSNVDEIPPDGDTSYNEFTVANRDRYTMENLGWTPADVHAVTLFGYAARDGTLTQFELLCATDTGGGGVTEAFGPIEGLASAGVYAPVQATFNVDPDTAVAWTPAGLDDLRAGGRFS